MCLEDTAASRMRSVVSDLRPITMLAPSRHIQMIGVPSGRSPAVVAGPALPRPPTACQTSTLSLLTSRKPRASSGASWPPAIRCACNIVLVFRKTFLFFFFFCNARNHDRHENQPIYFCLARTQVSTSAPEGHGHVDYWCRCDWAVAVVGCGRGEGDIRCLATVCLAGLSLVVAVNGWEMATVLTRPSARSNSITVVVHRNGGRAGNVAVW